MMRQFIIDLFSVAGGTAAAALLLIKFGGKWITDFLFEAAKAKRAKELENYKADLENHQYVTKKRFDKEFEIYFELSEKFSSLVEEINELIPEDGVINYPTQTEERKQYIEKEYINIKQQYDTLKYLLNKYSCFIIDGKDYRELLCKIKKQVDEFENVKNKHSTDYLSDDAYCRTEEINGAFEALQCEVRKYLRSLEVLP